MSYIVATYVHFRGRDYGWACRCGVTSKQRFKTQAAAKAGAESHARKRCKRQNYPVPV